MKAKVLFSNSRYKYVARYLAYVLESFSQIRSKLSMLLSEKKFESIGRSFSTQYLCPKFFNVRDYSGRFQE